MRPGRGRRGLRQRTRRGAPPRRPRPSRGRPGRLLSPGSPPGFGSALEARTRPRVTRRRGASRTSGTAPLEIPFLVNSPDQDPRRVQALPDSGSPADPPLPSGTLPRSGRLYPYPISLRRTSGKALAELPELPPPAEAASHEVRQLPGHRGSQGGVLALHHDAHHGFRAGGAHEDPAPALEALLGAGHRRGDLGILPPPVGGRDAHVEEHLGVAGKRRGELVEPPARLHHDVDQLEGGEEAVARGGVVEEDQVAARLAPQPRPRLQHPLQDVAVAHPDPVQLDPRPPERHLEPHVGHDRPDHPASGQGASGGQVEGHDPHDEVPVHERPAGIGGDDPVPVPVVGEPHVGPVGPHRLLDHRRVGGAAVGVDVEAVGRGVHGDDGGPEPLPQARGHGARGPVGAVHDDPPALEPPPRTARQEVEVAVGSVGDVEDAAHLPAGRPRERGGGVHERLDGVLHAVGQLEPRGREELDPVVLHRIVGGGDDDPRVDPKLPREERHARRGEDPQPEDVGPLGAQARGEGGLQEVARDPGVAPDGEPAPARGHEHPHRRPRDPVHELGGQVGVGDAPDAVGAEEASPGHHEEARTTTTREGVMDRRRSPGGSTARGVSSYFPAPCPEALTSTRSARGERRATRSCGPSTWTSTTCGTTCATRPEGTPTTRTGTSRTTVLRSGFPIHTETVARWTELATPGGSSSGTSRLSGARAFCRSTGAVGMAWTARRAVSGAVRVAVGGVTVTAVTAKGEGGAPTMVGTMGTTLVMTPSRTGSVASTMGGSTVSPRTSWPLASTRRTGAEVTSCCLSPVVSTVTTAWRTSSTRLAAPLMMTCRGATRGSPTVTPWGGVPMRLTSTGSLSRASVSSTTRTSEGVVPTGRTSAGVVTTTGTRCSPGLSPARSMEASSAAGERAASAERGPWRRTCTWVGGGWTRTSSAPSPFTCSSTVIPRSTRGFCAVATYSQATVATRSESTM